MADPASAAVTGPQLFSGHPAHHAPDGTSRLNAAELVRCRATGDPQRRLTYTAARCLWRDGARHFAGTHDLPLPDFEQLPPSGAVTPAHAPFHSSVCHTNSLVLTGFNRGPIGVDAEPLERHPDWARLARRWFARAETEWLHQQPDPRDAFLRLWTLKEAWIKATGRGIADNLRALVLDPATNRLRLDQPGADWHAAMTLAHGHRLSVLWRGAAPLHWWHEQAPCQAEWSTWEVQPQ